ncbi:GD15140 [Drosophila simulans]|uniref:GD15140 n=1 Tax=Drosophila simulans TaxID=7240 RepID=B4NT82_DROSI|nr:GD15140 [Drosophila simulans]
MEKFQHRKSCLSGPALDAVGALEVTDAHYPAAMELLDKRYYNKRLIFESHISAIMNIPKVECSSSVKLRELFKTPADIDIPTSCKLVNSWQKLKHVFGYIFKSRYRIKHPGLTVNHLAGGMKLIIRSMQMAHLTEDYNALLNSRQVKSSSPIASLAPIIDNSGLMRVGGRLKSRYRIKHPGLTVNHLAGGMKLIIRSMQMAHLTEDYNALLNSR